jgi:ATP-dependent Clp protease ATP-binding subunit ClpA
MASSPVSLDSLIAHVRSLRPDGGPLDHLSIAAAVSAELDNQADALLGHFVDQARRSGISWTQIGAHMGVSKQAVRKRFVPRWDGSDPIPEGQLFSRCTLRARNALLVAGRAGQDEVEPRHLVAGVLSEPEGLGAEVIHQAGLTDERICTALDVTAEDIRPHPGHDPRADVAALYQLRLTTDAQQALHNTADAARRLGHNFIGTEHILLGTLATEGDTADRLRALGLDAQRVEADTRAEIARIRAQQPEQA